MAIIKFPEDEAIKVTLDFDQPRTVEGDYGTQFQYGCNGGDDIFYASQSLSALIELTGATKGSKITIKKLQGSDEKTGKTFQYFTVNDKSLDDLSAPGQRIEKSPVQDKDYSHLTLAYLDERIKTLEGAMTKLEEKVKAGKETEEALPF